MNDSGPIADEIEGIPHPGESEVVVGHDEAVEGFLDRYKSGRMHHAHLVTGPKGIGKATLAMRLSSHLFRFPNAENAPDRLERADFSDPVDAKLAARSHPNLLHLQRPWDNDRKRFKQNLTVDEVRKTVPFFGTSKSEEGWRVAIVDAVDDMNRNAANALLKILEEPPERTVFFVLAHSPAKVLPTIRSRCQHIALKPLSGENVLNVLDRLEVSLEYSEGDRAILARLARGSVRDAITLAAEDGLDLYKRFNQACNQLVEPDWTDIHALADMVTGRGADNRFHLLFGFAERFLEENATAKDNPQTSISVLARWAEVWEKTRRSVRTADAYNLDRKQLVLNLFHDMGDAARIRIQ